MIDNIVKIIPRDSFLTKILSNNVVKISVSEIENFFLHNLHFSTIISFKQHRKNI